MAIPRLARSTVGSLVALALVGTPAAVLAAPNAPPASSTTAAAAQPDTTSSDEAKRVDRFATPRPKTFDCTAVIGVPSECGTVKLPLDYDRPTGAKTEVAYLRLKAKDQKNKIGTLFLNPGGPGGSGVDIASYAPYFLSPSLLQKFDIVGIDPRGTNFSDNVKCFENLGEQSNALSGIFVPFPYTQREENAYKRSSVKFGLACSTTGKPLSAHMSTANVARDMDVMRRVVGDKKLTYLGFSYGTYLGNVYANMYPDRVRSVAIDGVLDPVALPLMTIRVLIADDQAMVRGGLAALLDLEIDLSVVAEVGRGDEVVAAAVQAQPDVVLMDVEMPGRNGIQATADLRAALPDVRVLIVTTFGRPGFLRRAMQAGAQGFVVKDTPARQLAEAVRRVHSGLRVVDPRLATDSLIGGDSPLTERETDVLVAARSGGSIADIAKIVHLSEGTVRNHLSAAIGKTTARNRADAVRIADVSGWL